jgi:hypothetical protein
MKFGLSPRGVFITGEDARKLLESLLRSKPNIQIESNEADKPLRELARILTLADESSEGRVQNMKPYFESLDGLVTK